MNRAISLHVGVWRPAKCQGLKELQSPKADPYAMAWIACQAGFEVAAVMCGEEGTWKKVQPMICDAASELRDGGTFLLTFSGHGTNSSKDSTIQTWCMADGEVTERELFAELTSFGSDVRIIVVSASCFSGGLTGGVTALWKALHEFVETLLDGAAVQRRKAEEAERLARVMKEVKAAVLVLAACSVRQTALDDKPLSVFTNAIREVWMDPTFQGGYKTFIEKVREKVHKKKRNQDPKHIPLGAGYKWDDKPPFSILP